MANELKLKNAIVLGSLSSDPGTAYNGEMYYNTTTNTIRQYVNGSWQSVASPAGSGANTTLSNLTSPTAINQDLTFNKSNPAIAVDTSTNIQVLTNTGNDVSAYFGLSGSLIGVSFGSNVPALVLNGTTTAGMSAGANAILYNGSSQTGGLVIASVDVNTTSASTITSGFIQVNSGDNSGTGGSGDVAISSGDGGTTSGSLSITSGNVAPSGMSGSIMIETGVPTSGTGTLGNITLRTESSGSTSGKIQLQDGSESTPGSVWTLIDTSGSGTWASSATGANVALSNLINPTAVNQDLIFNTGAPANLKTQDEPGANTEDLTVTSGNVTSGTGNSGNVILSVGTPSGGGTQGNIQFQNGTEGTSGQIWTSTDTNGSGSWQPAASSGANTTLSNLTAPVAMNADLIFAETPTAQVLTQDATGSSNSAVLNVTTGTAITGNSGNVTISTGDSSGGQAGNILIEPGTSTSGANGSTLTLSGGPTSGGVGGSVLIQPGPISGGFNGSIFLRMGSPDDNTVGAVLTQLPPGGGNALWTAYLRDTSGHLSVDYPNRQLSNPTNGTVADWSALTIGTSGVYWNNAYFSTFTTEAGQTFNNSGNYEVESTVIGAVNNFSSSGNLNLNTINNTTALSSGSGNINLTTGTSYASYWGLQGGSSIPTTGSPTSPGDTYSQGSSNYEIVYQPFGTGSSQIVTGGPSYPTVTGTLTIINNFTGGETVSFDGVTFTAIASGTPTNVQFLVDVSSTGTASNLTGAVSSYPWPEPGVSASSLGSSITFNLTYLALGQANLIFTANGGSGTATTANSNGVFTTTNTGSLVGIMTLTGGPDFPGAAASFTGTFGGISTSVTLTANDTGASGNSIALVFNGSNTITQAIATWNAANFVNQVVLTSGNGAQTPSNGSSPTLTGGTGGSNLYFVASNSPFAAGNSGSIMLSTGTSGTSGTDGAATNSGNITLVTGTPGSNGFSGTVSIGSGNVTTGNSGNVDISAGAASLIAGNVKLTTGTGNGAGVTTGSVLITTGSGTGSDTAGNINLTTGSAVNGVSGNINLTTGNASNLGSSGQVTIAAGAAASSGSGGAINITGGASSTGQGGSVTIQGGTAGTPASAGDIQILDGSGQCTITVSPGGFSVTDNASQNVIQASTTDRELDDVNSNLVLDFSGLNSNTYFFQSAQASATNSTSITIQTGEIPNPLAATSGTVTIATGNTISSSSSASGPINIQTGTSSSNTTGAVSIASGGGTGAPTGAVSVSTGDSSGNNTPTGAITITTGNGANAGGGSTGGITLTTGNTTSSSPSVSTGSITLTTGAATGGGSVQGVVQMNALAFELPQQTSDPSGVRAGSMYYNTTSNVIRWYNGTVWATL